MLTLNDGRSELWQWDTGRTLAVDADCSQVHFSNKVFGRSVDVDVVDGAAIIPDILLQTDKDLNVWAFAGTAENGYTKISKTFKVNRRNKPADYVFTPPEQTTLSELVGRLDRIEESQGPDAIKNAVDDYLAQNPVEIPVQSVNGQTGAVELTAEDVGAIADETDPTVPEWAKQPTKPTYTAAEVGALPDTYTPPNQTAQQVGADPAGTAASAVSQHNTDATSHNDLRLALKGLSDRINVVLDSDDATMDQMSEVVAYIKSNKSMIDAITTSKVNVSDIVNNLTTNISNKPLSAEQGVALKELIDALSNSMTAYRTAAAQDVIDSGKVDKVTGKGLSSNDYTDAAKAKVDALAPVATSGSYNDLTNKPTIPTVLPNPHKLTINGTEYDGSTDVQMTIGGGGGSVPKPLTYDYMPEGYPKKSVQTTTLMEEQVVEFALEGDAVYTAYPKEAFELVEGKTYTVNWDGTEYERVCVVLMSTILALGNKSIFGSGDDTGEPFLYLSTGAFSTRETIASHTISVKTMGEVITPMAGEFLPVASEDNYGAVKKSEIVSAYNFPTNAPHDQMVEAIAAFRTGNASIVWHGLNVIDASYNSPDDTISVTFASEPLKTLTFSNNNGFYNKTLGTATYRELQGSQVRITNDNNVYTVLSVKGESGSETLRVSAERISIGSIYGISTTEMILKSSTSGSTKRFRITVDDSGAITATEVT